jgi:hypothetical protein
MGYDCLMKNGCWGDADKVPDVTIFAMTLNEWVDIGAGLSTIFFSWQQNRIFTRQNAIFASQGNTKTEPGNVVAECEALLADVGHARAHVRDFGDRWLRLS